jgi:hypothetical protein
LGGNFDMEEIFGRAYSAAQKATGPEQWELLSDAERMRAICEQIRRMDVEQIGTISLSEDRHVCASISNRISF